MKTKILGILWCVMMLCGATLKAQDLSYTWAKGIGGADDERGRSIAVDASGNVYTTGIFRGTVDFDPGVGVANLTNTNFGIGMFISKLNAAGNFVWAKAMTGVGATNISSSAIFIDAIGNIYTTGGFQGTADFDPDAGVQNLISNGGNPNIFICKLDASGGYIWAKAIGSGLDTSGGTSIAVDALGNVYTTGLFSFTADFDPSSAGVANLTATTSGGPPFGSVDVFVSKLNASGNFIWAKAMGGIDNDIATGIAVDATGNIYTTGSFQNTADFDPNAGIANLISVSPLGSDDIFISKLNPTGDFVWAKAMGGTSNDYASSITVDATGNVYTTGFFQNTADFDPNAGTANLISVGGNDIFVSKLNPSGNFIWVKSMGGTNSQEAYSIALDATGNIYTTGATVGTTDFDPNAGVFNLTPAGSGDIFISKLDISGDFVWAKVMGGTGFDQAYSIALDATNNVHIAGLFGNTADFNPNDCVANVTSAGTFDIFVAKYTQCPTSTITNTTLANGTIGNTYSQTLTQTGLTGTPTWSVCVGTLPAGLTLAPTTGIISGTPTATGTSSFVVSVSNGTCSAAKTLSIIVTCPTIAITPAFTTTQNYVVGTAVNITLGASGAGSATYTYAVTSGSLPLGVTFASGVISGTPTTVTTSGTFTITATSSFGACTGTQVYNYAVACPVLIFTNTTAAGATVGTPYTLNAGATGNNAPLTYSVTPALPAGLSINTATGVISGTPTTLTASATYIVAADPGGGCLKTTQTYTFGVTNCVPFALSPNKNFLPDGFVNVPYVGATISVAAPVAGVTYKFFKRNAINWQEGLTLNENTGVISGTPRFSTSINVVIEAVNQTTGCGSTLTSYTLVIYGDPATAVDNALENIIKVSPNPSSGDFSVDFGTINMAKSSVRVYDAQGKVVFTSENNTSASGNLMTISLEKFANGIYLMEVETSKGRILKRLAKQ